MIELVMATVLVGDVQWTEDQRNSVVASQATARSHYSPPKPILVGGKGKKSACAGGSCAVKQKPRTVYRRRVVVRRRPYRGLFRGRWFSSCRSCR